MRAGRQLRRNGSILAAGLATLCVAAPATAGATPALRAISVVSGEFVPGEAIVRFEAGTSSAQRREARREARVGFDEALGLKRGEVVEVDGSVAAAIRRLQAQPGVAYAQPNYLYEALAVEPPPDDTFFGQLWGLSDPALPDPGVSVLEAWEDNLGDGQVIAVVDTGVDLTHPDLEPNLWTNPDPDPDDLHGYDFVDDDGDPDDYQFHGTHVAGTAAAVADNDEGIAGVAPEAEIMAVRVLDGDGSGSTADIADGVVYAAEHGADVVNLSLGGPAGGDGAMEDAIELAGAADVVVVAAAGNEGANNDVEPHTPCALPQPNLICVAAVNQSGALASFSNYGVKSVDIAAPGGGVPGSGILSAKTDYGPDPPLFADDFESEFEAIWDRKATTGGIEWGLASKAAGGSLKSAADSPVSAQNYAPEAESLLITDDPVDLTSERGCRVHFRTMYEIEPPGPNGELFDAFVAGAEGEGIGAPEAFRVFADESSGYPNAFGREEVSISALDNRADVHPFFEVFSDELLEFDGAYVDDVRLICRDETYVDAMTSGTFDHLPTSGNYVRFHGTSMATPHVAGVVALVRAAAPGLDPEETVDAILAGASAIPNPDPSRRTATEGIADACQAIAVATGGDFRTECPGSSENVLPVEPGGPDTDPETSPPPPEPPPLDRRRPRTFFSQRPPRVLLTDTGTARAVFRFDSNETGVRFACRIDGGFYRPCRARLVRRFKVGIHVLRVVARDAAGNVDRTPAIHRFRVTLRD